METINNKNDRLRNRSCANFSWSQQQQQEREKERTCLSAGCVSVVDASAATTCFPSIASRSSSCVSCAETSGPVRWRRAATEATLCVRRNSGGDGWAVDVGKRARDHDPVRDERTAADEIARWRHRTVVFNTFATSSSSPSAVTVRHADKPTRCQSVRRRKCSTEIIAFGLHHYVATLQSWATFIWSNIMQIIPPTIIYPYPIHTTTGHIL